MTYTLTIHHNGKQVYQAPITLSRIYTKRELEMPWEVQRRLARNKKRREARQQRKATQ